jgi:hypothetical protein
VNSMFRVNLVGVEWKICLWILFVPLVFFLCEFSRSEQCSLCSCLPDLYRHLGFALRNFLVHASRALPDFLRSVSQTRVDFFFVPPEVFVAGLRTTMFLSCSPQSDSAGSHP